MKISRIADFLPFYPLNICLRYQLLFQKIKIRLMNTFKDGSTLKY